MKNLLFYLFLFPYYLFGQDTIVEKTRKPLLIIKPSLLSLIDLVHPSFQIAMEYPLRQPWSLQHEVGYIRDLFYIEGEDYNNKGIRIRNEARYYFSKRKAELQGFYFGPELLFIWTTFDRDMLSCFGFECDEKRKFYTVRKIVFAQHFKIGFQFGTGRFIMDLYMGGGFRLVNIKHIKTPDNDQIPQSLIFSIVRPPGNYSLPSVSLGFKLGFLLFKK